MSKYVIVHKNCSDGYAASYIAWTVFGNTATYLYLRAGSTTAPEIPDGSEIYMFDVVPPREVVLDWQQRMSKIVIQDHHATNQKVLGDQDGVYFDMTRSGAMLAFDYFYGDLYRTIQNSRLTGYTIDIDQRRKVLKLHELATYIQDTDLWRFQLPQSKEFFAGLNAYPEQFEVWDAFDHKKLAAEGACILRAEQQQINRALAESFITTIRGANTTHQIPVVNSQHYVSQIGNQLLTKYPEAPFSMVYSDLPDQRRRYSLRSEDGRTRVDLIAEQFGGGGHPNSAGFTIDRNHSLN